MEKNDQSIQHMRLSTQSLQNQNFKLLEKVEHTKFNDFLHNETWKSSLLQFLYYLFILFLGLLTLWSIWLSNQSILQIILFIAAGVVFGLFIVPLHEYIHYKMYKYLGASNVKIKTYLREGYVLTKADKFVVSKKEIKWIAPAPFIVISAVGAILMLIVSDLWLISVCTMFFFHATLCYSDFRILDYFLSRNEAIFMYDNIQEEATYIYQRMNQ